MPGYFLLGSSLVMVRLVSWLLIGLLLEYWLLMCCLEELEALGLEDLEVLSLEELEDLWFTCLEELEALVG